MVLTPERWGTGMLFITFCSIGSDGRDLILA
jgi:hypothetical protein